MRFGDNVNEYLVRVNGEMIVVVDSTLGVKTIVEIFGNVPIVAGDFQEVLEDGKNDLKIFEHIRNP